ncbi:MAG TPA: fluoride efflux transporter CrcB [Gemmatimonadaceae bacterium]|nr:fluoride efflux transporter CrcB [Gemmatimonadaceae bacterium]
MPPLSVLLGVAGGGALGSLLRFAVGRLLPSAPTAMPWSTLGINVLGSFALGLLAGASLARPDASPALRAFLGIGLLGGFTTFSTFSLETVTLAQSGSPARALLYITLSVSLAIAAAGIGFALARP